MGTKLIGVTTLTFSGSRDVVDNVTIRCAIWHFLLVVHRSWASISSLHCCQVCISNHFRDNGHQNI